MILVRYLVFRDIKSFKLFSLCYSTVGFFGGQSVVELFGNVFWQVFIPCIGVVIFREFHPALNFSRISGPISVAACTFCCFRHLSGKIAEPCFCVNDAVINFDRFFHHSIEHIPQSMNSNRQTKTSYPSKRAPGLVPGVFFTGKSK